MVETSGDFWEKRSVHMSIAKKIALGCLAVSVTTYGTSAFFIFVLQPYFEHLISASAFTLLTIAAGIFWTVLLGWLSARWFIRPLLTVSAAAAKVASGNLDVRVQESRSRDELGQLVNGFRDMLDNLKTMIREIARNSTVTNQSVVELSQAIESATLQIERISIVSSDIRSLTDEQESRTQQVLTSFSDIQDSVEVIKTKSSDTVELTGSMRTLIRESIEDIMRLIDGMRRLVEETRQSAEHVLELRDKADKISEFSDVVAEIANQTHLLALNASIEAAHAGELGRGFQVVAGEIRKLSEESTNAVTEINNLTAEIQGEIHEAVHRIRDQAELGEEEFRRTELVTEAIRKVEDSSARVTEAVSQVGTMIERQADIFRAATAQIGEIADMSARIAMHTTEVSGSTQEQTAFMEQLSATFEELRNMANQLNDEASKFVLPERERK